MQNIHVTAYSPMGTPPSSAMFKDYQPPLVMNDPVVKELAEKYKKNVGQVQFPGSDSVADSSLFCEHPKQSAILLGAQLCYVNGKFEVMLRNLSATRLLINALNFAGLCICCFVYFALVRPSDCCLHAQIMSSDYVADLHQVGNAARHQRHSQSH